MEEFNSAHDKKHVQSHLCCAKNDDPAGRTTLLLEGAHDYLEACDHDQDGSDSEQSRQGKRRAWQKVNLAKHNDNLVKRWHAASAVKWITTYAAQLSPSKHATPHGPNAVLEDSDAPGGAVYETVKHLMQTQNIQGDPQDFIPAYKKELETVTTLRLKEVSPAVAQYVRAKKLAVRLRMILTEKKDKRRKGRLVIQGFRAPSWWRVGSTDSPVVATAGLRALIFRRDKQAGQREVVSQFDFDVAFLQANGFAATEPTRHVSYRPHPGYST